MSMFHEKLLGIAQIRIRYSFFRNCIIFWCSITTLCTTSFEFIRKNYFLPVGEWPYDYGWKGTFFQQTSIVFFINIIFKSKNSNISFYSGRSMLLTYNSLLIVWFFDYRLMISADYFSTWSLKTLQGNCKKM